MRVGDGTVRDTKHLTYPVHWFAAGTVDIMLSEEREEHLSSLRPYEVDMKSDGGID